MPLFQYVNIFGWRCIYVKGKMSRHFFVYCLWFVFYLSTDRVCPMHSVKNLKIDSTVGFGAFTITLVLYFHFFYLFLLNSWITLHGFRYGHVPGANPLSSQILGCKNWSERISIAVWVLEHDWKFKYLYDYKSGHLI